MLRQTLSIFLMFWGLVASTAALAHEGHDHDKPPPLNLPVAPRVVAVTPDFELVAVSSGPRRLTLFLHTFATNEPVAGAKMNVSAGDNATDAKAEGDGVFTVSAPWLDTSKALDLVFALTLKDGTQDLLTGQLEQPASQTPAASQAASAWTLDRLTSRPELLLVGGAGLMTGVLFTLLLTGGATRRASQLGPSHDATPAVSDAANSQVVKRRAAAVVAFAILIGLSPADEQPAIAAERQLPSVPSTMATDLAQRMPDSTLFVPKATQHLLSIRTLVTARGQAARSMELTGTVVAGPEHFGRVQPGRPGRIEAPPGGIAFIGKRVEKGELLGYVRTYIEAADRANMDSLIAETEARINKNQTILSRYMKSPGSVPQVKIDEVRGELEAQKRKRAGLMPSVSSRATIVAPISGVVSVANATIGQIVDARDVLFEIVDPSQFWVEAIAHDPKVSENLAKAFAVSASGTQIPLGFEGQGLALRQQAAILMFRISGAHDGLSIGMPVRVVLQSTVSVEGFVLPASSIVRGQTGLPIVWIKSEPERFEPQVVKVLPLDGRSIVVTAGLKEDQRVVTQGVTLLNQVR
jgi:membrane fusion protein, heavy metal efflux system